jgi:ribosomal-protein-alanine N-acetyltransferase
MDVTIEPLRTADELDQVLDVERASFTNPWTREMYLAELNNTGVSFCYIAKTPTGEILGFCSFWRVVEELHINNLAVAPAHRRAGIASALLDRVLRDGAALGATLAMLEVRRSNEAALQLYERFGFLPAGVRRRYYTNPIEDALVLWRDGLTGWPHVRLRPMRR